MANKISLARRILYLVFGISGALGLWFTGFRFGNAVGSFFHSAVLIGAVNWGIVGITGRDGFEWIEFAAQKIKKGKAAI